MTRVRLGLAAMLVALATSGAIAASAVAAPTPVTVHGTGASTLYTFPIKGFAKNGKTFKGTFGIQRLVPGKTADGKPVVYAVGTLTGRLAGHRVTRNNVRLPVQPSIAAGSSNGSTTSTRQAAAGATCPILHLTLGPVNLNLLGLQVVLAGGSVTNQQPIVLDLTAHQGGGLLGDLLCGVSNALGGSSALSQLTSQLQQLLGTITGILGQLGV